MNVRQRVKSAIDCLFGQIPKVVEIVKVPIYHTMRSESSLSGHVALIAGGTGGIGRRIAECYLKHGCKVIVGGTSRQKLEDIKKELSHPNLETLVCDVRDTMSFPAIFSDSEALFPGVDILVSSVGVHTENVDFWNMSPDEFDRVMSVNLRGNYFLCQAFARHMRKCTRSGHILMISSCRGFEPAFSPYGISKWALNGFVRGLARELIKYRIVVNGIAPGTVATRLINASEENINTKENVFERHMLPSEVAELAMYMVSGAGDFILGEVVPCSAGRGVFDLR